LPTGSIDSTAAAHGNVSGRVRDQPAAGAPDGTPGHPPARWASRAIDKTPGATVSGANPGRKT
jgi:hypothetical protein